MATSKSGAPHILLTVVIVLVTHLCVVWGQAIRIESQPTSLIGRLDKAEDFTFRVTASGGRGRLTFTWYLNSTIPLNQTNNYPNGRVEDRFTFTKLAGVQQSYRWAGTYSCRVTDSNIPPTSIQSSAAVFTVGYIPQFTVRPADITANMTADVTFHCQADAFPAANYQWHVDNVKLDGETRTSLTLRNITPAQNGNVYKCVISNTFSFNDSSAILTVISRAPYFIQDLSSGYTVNYSDPFNLTCVADGIPGVSYQWYVVATSGARTAIAGATGNILHINTTFEMSYECAATSLLGTITTTTQLSINIVLPSNSLNVYAIRTYVGYPLLLQCHANGVPKPNVFWRFKQSGYNIVRVLPSVDGSYYYKASVQKSDQGFYTCVSTNVAGQAIGPDSIYVIVDAGNPDPIFTATSISPMTTQAGVGPTILTPVTSSILAVTTGVFRTTLSDATELRVTTVSGAPVSMASSQSGQPTTGQSQPVTTVVDPERTTQPLPTTTAPSTVPVTTAQNSTTGPNDGQVSSDDNVVTIVVPVIVVIVVVGITVVIILLFLNHKRRMLHSSKGDQKPLTTDSGLAAKDTETNGPELEMDIMASVHPELSGGHSRRASTVDSPLSGGLTWHDMTDLLTRVETAITSGERSNELVAQYESVPLNMVSIEHSPASLGTEHKNRYMNVLPNPDTAVRLEEDPPGDYVSTYINANYVQDYYGKTNAFIATQGPTADTINDFWRMIWQEDISVIVMATQLVERGRAKCMRYWPEEESDEVYGKLTVNVDDVTDQPDYILTTMSVFFTEDEGSTESTTSRTVSHFWFKGWPDFGIPEYTEPVLDFIDTIVATNTNRAPILIHCSAGIGRTGTLVAIKMGMQQYTDHSVVNPVKYLDVLRQCRGGCIQTFDQYLFVHRALLKFMNRAEQQSGQQRDEVTTDSGAIVASEDIEGEESETKLL